MLLLKGAKLAGSIKSWDDKSVLRFIVVNIVYLYAYLYIVTSWWHIMWIVTLAYVQDSNLI